MKDHKIFASSKQGNVTSSLYSVEVILKWNELGKISVILPEFSTFEPFVSYSTGQRLTNMRYLSISAGDSKGVARWFLDCPHGLNKNFVN